MYAAPTPRAISVNMLGLTWIRRTQARSKNGQPHQKTTGVASASWIHYADVAGGERLVRQHFGHGQRKTGSPSTRLTQNRRVMSSRSGLALPPVTVRGSSAMPHFGQVLDDH